MINVLRCRSLVLNLCVPKRDNWSREGRGSVGMYSHGKVEDMIRGEWQRTKTSTSYKGCSTVIDYTLEEKVCQHQHKESILSHEHVNPRIVYELELFIFYAFPCLRFPFSIAPLR